MKLPDLTKVSNQVTYLAYTTQFDTMQRYLMVRCTWRLSQNGLQIRFRSSNRCNVKLLHQEVQDIGGYKSR